LEYRRDIDIADYTAWKAGFIQFNNTPLQEAIIVLKKWYKVDFALANPKLAKCQLSGKYPTDDLTTVLESIKFIKGIDYRFETKSSVVLSGQACVSK
jgi:ferric-dicitrate binding protein FerR (iron transport regulator)